MIINLDKDPIEPKEVRKARLELGMTQSALAQNMGVNERTVRSWESGTHPCTGAARKLLQLLLVLEGEVVKRF